MKTKAAPKAPANPFPEVAVEGPFWVNHGTCYSRAAYRSEEAAEAVAEVVRAQGGHVNGGFMHGVPLGQLTRMHDLTGPYWEVTF